MRLNFTIIFLIALKNFSLLAHPIINISDDKLQLIGKYCQIYAGEASIDEILAFDDSHFKQNPNEHLLIGGTKPKNVWAKFTINNQLPDGIYLEMMYPLLEKAQLYTVENNQVIDIQDFHRNNNFSDRTLYNTNPSFILKKYNSPRTYYLNISAEWMRNVKLRVGSNKGFFKTYHYNNLFNGLFIGLVLVFILYNLFIYFKTKEPANILYSLYLIFSSAFVLRHYGLLDEFLLNAHPNWNDYTLCLMGFAGIFGLLFTMRILQTEKKIPNVHVILLISAIVYGMSAIWALYGYFELSVMTGYFITPVSTIAVVIAAIHRWRQGDKVAPYYLLGWSLLTIGTALFILENMGLIAYHSYNGYALHAGIGFEAAILSMTIALHFSKMKAEKDEIKINMIEVLKENERLVQEQNRMLEQKIAEHTKELRSTLIKYNESEIKLRDYAQKLEKSNRELTEFAHIASHDLKAPIRNIMSFVQLFERRHKAKFDDTDREYFSYIKTNAQQSARLIDDLLSYSKIDKNLGIPEEVDLEKCVFISESNLQTLIRDRNAIVEHENLPILRGHSSLITQLFQNLINNGIKYNKSESPKIFIKSELNAENEYVFSVKDNGIGIAAENFNTVFAMFRRLHTQSEYEGTGIGLSFCTRIVETYGGRMWLESIIGQGTTFYFTLPKAEVLQKELELVYS